VRRAALIAPLLLAGPLLACPKEKEAVKTPPKPPASSPSAPAPAASSAAAASPARDRREEEACLDRWLAERKLDSYGSPEGTMYAGGTPLFDEATGRSTDRREYVYAQHPDARAACAPKTGH
jgi:hypothetical protein